MAARTPEAIDLNYTVVVRQELGGWYSATAPVLPGRTWTGSSHAQVLEEVEASLSAWLAELKSQGQDAPPDAPAVLVELGDASYSTVHRVPVRMEAPRKPDPDPTREPLPPPRQPSLPADVAAVIFREWYLRRIAGECAYIGRFLAATRIPWSIRMGCASARRPARPELLDALRRAAATTSEGSRYFGECVARVDGRRASRPDPEELIAELSGDDPQARLAAQFGFVELPYGWADLLFPLLPDDSDEVAGAAAQVLSEMAGRIGGNAGLMVCMQCFRRDRRSNARARPDAAVPVLVCRSCALTRHLTLCPEPVVCVLDGAGPTAPVHTGDSLRVNWLARAREGLRGRGAVRL